MKCSKVQEWISLEMDDQLPPEHVGELEDHLEACAECHAFREDLSVGLRMLHATDPVLPDNFDWKLQLRLSQTLRETARDTAYPWHREESGWRRWVARASLSAAVGLAAVLAVAVMAPNRFATVTDRGDNMAFADQPLRLPVQTRTIGDPLQDTTRRPIEAAGPGFTSLGSGSGLQRRVSTGNLGSNYLGGSRDADLIRMQQLEKQIEVLQRRMNSKDNHITVLEAKLDSLTGANVDTH